MAECDLKERQRSEVIDEVLEHIRFIERCHQLGIVFLEGTIEATVRKFLTQGFPVFLSVKPEIIDSPIVKQLLALGVNKNLTVLANPFLDPKGKTHGFFSWKENIDLGFTEGGLNGGDYIGGGKKEPFHFSRSPHVE